MGVAQTADAVLAPPVRAGVGLVEREVRPCVAIGGVVLADRAPLTPRLVRTPYPPRCIRGKVGDPRAFRAAIALGGQSRVTRLGGHGLLLGRRDDASQPKGLTSARA